MGEEGNEEFLLNGYKGTVKQDESTSETCSSISSHNTFHDHIFNTNVDMLIDP